MTNKESSKESHGKFVSYRKGEEGEGKWEEFWYFYIMSKDGQKHRKYESYTSRCTLNQTTHLVVLSNLIFRRGFTDLQGHGKCHTMGRTLFL